MQKFIFFSYYLLMKCKTGYLREAMEPIESLWEIRFSKEKTRSIKQIAQKNQITLSMVLRYCIFRLVDILAQQINTENENNDFLKTLTNHNLNFLKIPDRQPLRELCKKKPYQLVVCDLPNANYFIHDGILLKIFAAMQKCFAERVEHNKDFHRFVICLYGADEALLRQMAGQLGITVALLIRSAIELYLWELELPEQVTDSMLLKYAIKHSIVMKFHNNYFQGKSGPGNYALYSIYFPEWKFWPIKRDSRVLVRVSDFN